MNFPISDESGVTSTTVTTNLDSQPLYAEQLGHISVAWANLEWQLYNIFQIFSGAPPAVARSIFYAIDSTRGRREMVAGIANVLLEDKSDKSILDDILRRVGKTSSQRNKYVHDTWGITNSTPPQIFQMRMSTPGAVAKMEETTLPDMRDTVAHIKKLADEISNFRRRVEGKVPSLLEKYRKLPGLGLEYVPKGHPPGRKPKGHHAQRKS